MHCRQGDEGAGEEEYDIILNSYDGGDRAAHPQKIRDRGEAGEGGVRDRLEGSGQEAQAGGGSQEGTPATIKVFDAFHNATDAQRTFR